MLFVNTDGSNIFPVNYIEYSVKPLALKDPCFSSLTMEHIFQSNRWMDSARFSFEHGSSKFRKYLMVYVV